MKNISICMISIAFLFLTNIAFAAEVFYFPKRENQWGYEKLMFIDAKNGEQFCEEEGYNRAVGGTIYCGEDESAYVTYDWYQKEWKSQPTGSKNQCYPLYASIICS